MDKVLIYIALTLVVTSSAAPRRLADTEDAELKDLVEASKLRKIRVNDDDKEARFSDPSAELVEQARQLSQPERQEQFGQLAKLGTKVMPDLIGELGELGELFGRAADAAGSDASAELVEQARQLSQPKRQEFIGTLIALASAAASAIGSIVDAAGRAADTAGSDPSDQLRQLSQPKRQEFYAGAWRR